MDALSDVLGAIRLTGAVFLEMELHAQWSYLTAPARKIADVLMPDADHVIPYHLVTEGTCCARLVDEDPVEVRAGDLILFPAGDRHVLSTARAAELRLKPTDITGESLSKLLKRGDIAALKKGRAGSATRIVCGFLACDRRLAEPILLSLPRLLKVTMRDDGTAAWVRSSIRYSVAESASSRPGSAVVLARLSEVLFAEAVRHYMDGLPPGQSGWLAGLRDRYVFPHGDAHVMGSNLGLAPQPLGEIMAPPRRGEVQVMQYGGNGEQTRVVCGFLACDPQLCRPILSALPRVFRVSIRNSPSGEWLQSSIRHSVTEAASPRAGADVILARLSEVLFVESLRCYVETLPPGETGWLAGLRDPYVSKGLKLLHTRFDEPWTVDELAREVGCSRSVLAERFTHFLGLPPIQYLTSWRLARAASLLRAGTARLVKPCSDRRQRQVFPVLAASLLQQPPGGGQAGMASGGAIAAFGTKPGTPNPAISLFAATVAALIATPTGRVLRMFVPFSVCVVVKSKSCRCGIKIAQVQVQHTVQSMSKPGTQELPLSFPNARLSNP